MTDSNLLGPEIAVLLSDIAGIDPCNSRGDEAGETFLPELRQLAATLQSRGQVHPLILRPAPVDHRWRVLVGGRAFRALQLIDGADGTAQRIRARVFNGDDDEARALSLAENFARRRLHPLDEARRFAELAQRMSIETVARDFGVSRKFVRERLALGMLAPGVAAAWRSGAISEGAAREFVVLDGPAQEEALARFSRADLAHVLAFPAELRHRLRADAPRADCAAALFVGVESYVRAGGQVAEDLFDHDARLLDGALLRRLERDKLTEAAELIRVCEGWGFSTIAEPGRPSDCAIRLDWTDEEAAKADALENQLAGLSLDDPAYQETFDRLDALDALGALRACSAEERARLGVVVSVDDAGALVIERGMRMAAAPFAPSAIAQRSSDGGENASAQPDATKASPSRGDEGRRDAESQRDAEDGQPDIRAAAKRASAGTAAPELDTSVHPAARRVAETAATHALTDAVAANPQLAAMLALVSLARSENNTAIGLRRWPNMRGIRHPLAMEVGRASFRDGLARAAAAPPNEVIAAIFDCVAASVDLRGRPDHEQHVLIEAASVMAPGLAAAIADRFDYAAYFDNASRATALGAIRDIDGAAGEMAAGWRKDGAAAQDAALAARAARWLPEAYRAPGWIAYAGQGDAIVGPGDEGQRDANIEAAE